MKAIHNNIWNSKKRCRVVLYLKDTQKWKQFTTTNTIEIKIWLLCYISKILKNESNSQHWAITSEFTWCCVISQRYSKMKAIHNLLKKDIILCFVVLYLKDTQKWKQFTTCASTCFYCDMLCYISKILKNESNSQQFFYEL